MQPVSVFLAAAFAVSPHHCHAQKNKVGKSIDEMPLRSSITEKLYTASKNALDAQTSADLFAKFKNGLGGYEGEIFEAIFFKSLTPIPSYCVPREGIAPLYVLTKDKIALVRERREGSYRGIFDVSGLVLLDNDANGMPEAYGFGSERSSMGGDSGPHHSVRLQESPADLVHNFENGLTVIPWHAPTLFIDMSYWTCRPNHFPNGDISRR